MKIYIKKKKKKEEKNLLVENKLKELREKSNF